MDFFDAGGIVKLLEERFGWAGKLMANSALLSFWLILVLFAYGQVNQHFLGPFIASIEAGHGPDIASEVLRLLVFFAVSMSGTGLIVWYGRSKLRKQLEEGQRQLQLGEDHLNVQFGELHRQSDELEESRKSVQLNMEECKRLHAKCLEWEQSLKSAEESRNG